MKNKPQFTPKEIKDSLQQMVKEGKLRHYKKGGKDYWVNADNKQN